MFTMRLTTTNTIYVPIHGSTNIQTMWSSLPPLYTPSSVPSSIPLPIFSIPSTHLIFQHRSPLLILSQLIFHHLFPTCIPITYHLSHSLHTCVLPPIDIQCTVIPPKTHTTPSPIFKYPHFLFMSISSQIFISLRINFPICSQHIINGFQHF